MPKRTVWACTQSRGQSSGCDLLVSLTGTGQWTWLVVQDGLHVADGVAASREAGQDAAVAAARRHAERHEPPDQLTLF